LDDERAMMYHNITWQQRCYTCARGPVQTYGRWSLSSRLRWLNLMKMTGKSLDDVSNISEDLRISIWLSRWMMVLPSSGGLMHHLLCTQTWGVTLAELCHSEKGLYTQCPENNASILRALLKQNWLEWMMECHWSSGLAIFWKRRYSRYVTMLSFKTIRVPSYWQQMARPQVGVGHDTLTFGTSLFWIGLLKGN
jgi:hypothetical protein